MASSALNDGVEAATGEILVFTDADCLFEPGTLRRLVSNFADARVGGVAANQVRAVREDAGRSRAARVSTGATSADQADRGPGRSAVSATGDLYAVRGALLPAVASSRDRTTS